MISTPSNNEQAPASVIIRQTETGWSALLGRFQDGKLERLETKEFPLAAMETGDSKNSSAKEEDGAHTPTSELDMWLEQNEVNQVYTLLAAGRTITRVLELNVSEDEDVEQALRLQAESHLLGGAPAYRVGMASLPSRSDQQRQGILFSWPDKGEVDLPETNETIWFVPETAALLGLVPAKVQGNLFVHSDRQTGSISILLDTPKGLIARSTRIMQKGDSWKQDVVKTVVETAISSNMMTEEVSALKKIAEESIEAEIDSNQCLIIPKEAKEQVQEWVSEPLERDWMNEWGLSLGALFAQSGKLASLTRLQSDRQMGNIGPVGELVRTFSQTQTTLAILAATLIAMTLVPLFSAWTSNAIIKGKIDDLESLSTALEIHDTQKGIYNEVATRSWPMTKLLGDLANCIPLGIEADTIMINEGDSIILRGRAGKYKGMNPNELLGNMLTQLDDTGVFENATYSNEPINSSGVIDFSLTARVKSPFLYVRNFDHDFGKVPHVQLRYPGSFKDSQSGDSEDGLERRSQDETSTAQTDSMLASEESDGRSSRSSAASSSTRSSLGDSSRNSSRPRSSSSSSAGRSSSLIGSSASAARRSDQTTARGSSGPAIIPESPTNNELSAMSKSEAKALLTKVAEARQRKDLDEETKVRLKLDFDRIITHMKSARDEGDS
jgi:Tfp pilus assembly protein PilN